MNETYTYDEIYGILIGRNKADTVRTYFIIECQYHKFYVWMFIHGWNKVKSNRSEQHGLKGFKITFRRA